MTERCTHLILFLPASPASKPTGCLALPASSKSGGTDNRATTMFHAVPCEPTTNGNRTATDAAGARNQNGQHRCKPLIYMVPGAGIEPAWPQGRGILSPLRIPVSPPGRRAECLCTGGADRSMHAQRDCRETCAHKKPAIRRASGWRGSQRDYGGRGRNRTGVRGFAVRCMTTLPPGQMAQSRSAGIIGCR